MDIIQIDQSNQHILFNLAQAYEAEFSFITKKKPDRDGLLNLDSQPDEHHDGYLLFDGEVPIGFAVIGKVEQRNDVAEFYILPSARRNGTGTRFAHQIFDRYSGEWQVRQIAGADEAIVFWRNAISKYTADNYQENTVNDPDWGTITRQVFSQQQR